MKILLLSHERELEKKSNTGMLVREVLAGDCELLVWKRTEANESLLELLAKQQAALLFPAEALPVLEGRAGQFTEVQRIADYSHLVILDATWQQAKKMYRQSPYLQQADKLALENVPASTFVRRRNQREGGLCTAECVVELLKLTGDVERGQLLATQFMLFNQRA